MHVYDLILLLGQYYTFGERLIYRSRLKVVVNRRFGNRTVMSRTGTKPPLRLERTAAIHRERTVGIDVTYGNVGNAYQVQHIGPDLEYQAGLAVTVCHRYAGVVALQRI